MKNTSEYTNHFRILKGGKISLVVSALLTTTTLIHAAPSGGVVTSGDATIANIGKVTDIAQSTQKASINWTKFNIAHDEVVNFKQPNVNSITLNRVVGNERSIINGALNANGQVMILNSNGVLFGKNAKINTAGLLATTKELSDADFQAGNYHFKGNSTESVINLGEIDISDSGYAVFLAHNVSNEGTIKAVRGSVRLVGANEVTINLNGNSIMELTVNKGVLDALVENKGAVYADGGDIYLTTNAVDELLKGVVNNTGVIEANSLDGITGHIELFAHGGETNVAGTINAHDGFVETSGDKVKIDDSFKVTADKWLIDPTDFTIAASGGDMSGATLSSNLADADVEIQSVSGTIKTDGNGDINVNDTIAWNSDKKLTLNAKNDIFINSDITSTHANGKLELQYGQKSGASSNDANYHINAKVNLHAGENFTTIHGNPSNGISTSTTWTVVTDATAMQNISKTGNSVLGADITLSGTDNWNPIGKNIEPETIFTGKFDGLGHAVSNLHKHDASKSELGLFGYTKGATIQNIGVINADISGKDFLGILVGNAENSTIKNAYTTGKILGTDGSIGGLVGNTQNSNIENSYSLAEVQGKYDVGGLVGNNYAFEAVSTIKNSYATGEITGKNNVGGLVGKNRVNSAGQTATASITNSYATGNIIGTNDSIGGLVGINSTQEMGGTGTASITNSYASNSVTGIHGNSSLNSI